MTIAIGTNPGGGTLSGTLSAVTGSTGIATFDTLSINQLGAGYTLVASTAGFSTATSVPFTIASSVTSGVTVFNNKIAFLAATGATNATGPLPSLGAVNSGATVGSVTFNLAPGAQNLEHRRLGRLVSPLPATRSFRLRESRRLICNPGHRNGVHSSSRT